MTGKHIELFLVEGVPGGITTAEIAGWTGHVLAGPRSDLGDVLKRPEAKRNGAYFLLGDDEEAVGGVRCYVGRTENFIARFRDHSAKKEFWDRVALSTGATWSGGSLSSRSRRRVSRWPTATIHRAAGSRRRKLRIWKRSWGSCRSSCRYSA